MAPASAIPSPTAEAIAGYFAFCLLPHSTYEHFEMTTADWAFVISLLSFIVSLSSFVWNIWSKYIYPKSQIKVRFNMMIIIGTFDHRKILSLAATNFGPTDTQLTGVICRERISRKFPYFRRNWQYGFLNSFENPEIPTGSGIYSGGLPKKLAVGDKIEVYLTPLHEALRDKKIIDVGFIDIFGRYLWAPRSDVRKARDSVKAHFAEQTQGSAT
ncbi:hypothetical protein E4V01_07520 [Methylorubrum sp. Q1]|uniref:hypothetical protein n=1 Tax=Methylorubrum sp. Q1 TaxID=2562453 RepID=UPI0010760F23|nr:hypothetical protein [Methylorubrum sp. Q1]TFZ59790.1 hypothetical protein E4V01_07520 [Methylorubrum sp. Q1]